MSQDNWFCALLDSAADVYFRYAFEPVRRLVYISPAVTELTGHPPDAFYDNPDFCLGLIPAADRRVLRRMLRSRRAQVVALRLVRQGVAIPIELRSVAIVRRRRLVAIEGSVRVAVVAQCARGAQVAASAREDVEPTQQRLAALMCEVHELLHRVLPPAIVGPASTSNVLRCGALALDLDRMTVDDDGRAVDLTSREVMVLRYFLQRPDRIVTRRQLLEEVWAYTYTGDDRTVDVHVSRLRRKLPSLRGRLVAVKHLGYRLDTDVTWSKVANS